MKTRSNFLGRGALLLLAVVVASQGLLAQTGSQSGNPSRGGRGARVQGRVVPTAGSSQVPEVMVVKLYRLSGPLLETALVRNGRFLFPGVGDGQYRLRLESEGFQPTEQDFVLENVIPGEIEFVQLNLGAPVNPGDVATAGSATVDAGSLSLRREAAAELEKAAKASRKKRYAKAVEHIQKAIEISPDYYQSYNNLGVQFLRLERYSEAQDAFNRSLQLQPSAMAYVNLGNLLMHQEQVEKALPLLQKAHQLDSRDDLTIRSLGEAYFRAGQYEPALSHFEDLALRDKDPTLNIGKANCYLRLNRLEEARREFNAFLEKESRGQRADYIRAQLKSIEP